MAWAHLRSARSRCSSAACLPASTALLAGVRTSRAPRPPVRACACSLLGMLEAVNGGATEYDITCEPACAQSVYSVRLLMPGLSASLGVHVLRASLPPACACTRSCNPTARLLPALSSHTATACSCSPTACKRWPRSSPPTASPWACWAPASSSSAPTCRPPRATAAAGAEHRSAPTCRAAPLVGACERFRSGWPSTHSNRCADRPLLHDRCASSLLACRVPSRARPGLNTAQPTAPLPPAASPTA